MPRTQIRGGDIANAVITAAHLASSFLLPTAMLTEGALFLKRDGTVSWTASQNAGGFLLTGLGTPSAATDVATKGYVDTLLSGFDPKPAANVASNSNIASKAGIQTIDGVAGAAGMRVLLLGQTTASENGVWVMNSGAWNRPPDWAAGSTTAVTDGAYVLVELGTQYGGTGWVLTTQGTITVDTTNETFVQFRGAQSTTAGNGIAVTGNSVAVKNGNGVTFDGANAVTLNLNGASLTLAAAGLKISDAASGGQVMLGGAANAATFTTLSGDVASVSSAGAVALATGIRRTANFVDNELPGGTINGTNTSFTLANTPLSGTLHLFYDGIRQRPGAGNDYTLAAGTITMLTAPEAGGVLVADYQI